MKSKSTRYFSKLLMAAAIPFPLPADLILPRGDHAKPALTIFVPQDSPLTADRIALGEILFSDQRLSRDQSLACINCHRPETSFTSNVVTARFRNPPVIFNRLFSRNQFWDGRANSIEDQIQKTISEPAEMNFSGREVVMRLKKDSQMVERFKSVFGKSGLEEKNLYRALASFVRSIISYDSKYDRVSRKMPGEKLSELEEQGRKLFFETYKCSVCHSGPNFTNEILSPKCYPQFGQLPPKAQGARRRFNQEFKTPTLRGLARSAPYFHNGGLTEIEEVVEFYDRTGSPPMDFENAELFQVPLNSISKAEAKQLTAFLGTLNGRIEYGFPRKTIDASLGSNVRE